MHNLLLVEDDAAYAGEMAAAVRRAGHQVAIAGDAATAFMMLERDAYDAIVLDRMLPGLDGISFLERIRAAAKYIPVIIVSALGLSLDRVDGLRSGADDYLVKPADPVELLARIEALVRARGWSAGPGDTLRAGDLVVSPAQMRATRGGRALTLTKTEFDLLAELARNAGAVVTRAMLIERVWGLDFEPTTNIVDVHVRGLRRKLTAGGEDDPILTVRGRGYSLPA